MRRRTPIVGVTGPPAAGKSTFASALGAQGGLVIDVDRLGHEALAGTPVRDAVRAAFGPGVLAQDGSVDRRALAAVAFGEPASVRRLEAIVHPAVRTKLTEELEAARRGPAPFVVLDCALLFEGGLDALCDLTVDVDAPEALRLERAASRGWDAEELRRRQETQLPAATKRSRADRVVVNDADPSHLSDEAKALVADLHPPAARPRALSRRDRS